MPADPALRNDFSPGRGFRSRPIGSPRKMVPPAMKPSSVVRQKLMSYAVTPFLQEALEILLNRSDSNKRAPPEGHVTRQV